MVVYVGVFAYNEERLIARNIQSILSQDLSCVDELKVFVVSSGSTDRTDEIVSEIAERDRRVVLIVEEERRGKASAINRFLEQVPDNEICVMVSGDVILEGSDCLCNLIKPFREESVGMTASHPVPVDDRKKLMGRVVNVLWDMKHRISLISPKTGEMVAFRKVFSYVPADVLVDEAYIEWEIMQKGLRIVYVPDAIVKNKGPETFSEFIRQRKRIYIGHKLLEKRLGYKGSTFDIGRLFRVVFDLLRENPEDFIAVFLAIFLEIYSRVLGRLDIALRRYDTGGRWEIIDGTKSMD